MSRTVSGFVAPLVLAAQERSAPVIAEVGDVRLLWHLRELRGARSLREAAELVGMNRDELGRIDPLSDAGEAPGCLPLRPR